MNNFKTLLEDLLEADSEMRVWEVWIKNNYYDGKYPNYSAMQYPVAASSKEEAVQVVLKHADYILKDLLSKKSNGKKILPKKTALPITKDSISEVVDSTIKGKRSSHDLVTIISMKGPISVVLDNGRIVNKK